MIGAFFGELVWAVFGLPMSGEFHLILHEAGIKSLPKKNFIRWIKCLYLFNFKIYSMK